jgi:hypothetical protein
MIAAAWTVVATAVLAGPPPSEAVPLGGAAAPDAGAAGRPTGVEEIVDRYNEGVHRALAGIESLRVAQTIFEPQDDGGTKRACAILSYGRGRGMVREETFSELVYPVGEYTLASLVGPVLDRSAYSVEYGGLEEADGVSCHRLDVTATSRDYRHFDGSVWISADSYGPVRIAGHVADPPFPAVEVELDKVFSEGPHGLRLVRRHVGRGEFRVLFITKRGERTIYYDDYEVEFAKPSDDALVEPLDGAHE